jgi:hypothetical protein
MDRHLAEQALVVRDHGDHHEWGAKPQASHQGHTA